MKLILFILISLALHANPLDKLDINQQIIMSKVFEKGKQFDLEFSLTAIVWQESQFGKYKIDLNDPSCGIFHIMPRSLIHRVDMDNNSWNRSRLCERLISDDDFSFSAALLELKYWQNYWKSKHVKRVWSHMISSYNGGYKGNKQYLKEIKQKIEMLKEYYEERR